MTYSRYRRELFRRFWSCREVKFRNRETLFDRCERSDTRPPVFLSEHAAENILIDPLRHVYARVLGEIPTRRRHLWFRSMRSSQALAQSVFAYLKHYDRLALLAAIRDEEGLPTFFDRSGVPRPEDVSLEQDIDTLHELRSTSVDVFFRSSGNRIAVECKLAEDHFGWCSRPRLKPNDPKFATEHCDGRYLQQRDRIAPCSLTELGITYWNHIPKLLDWDPSRHPDPCPLHRTYQLARNLLAACVQADKRVDTERGHAVLVYDARNPAFKPGGEGDASWQQVRQHLADSRTVRRCSWQRILWEMREAPEMRWLVEELGQKYGLQPEDGSGNSAATI